MQAVGTQQSGDHTPMEPIRAFGGIKTVVMHVLGNMLKAQALTMEPGDPCAEGLESRQLVIPRPWADHAMAAGHPAGPVQRHVDLRTLVHHMDGDALQQPPHDLLPLLGGGLRSLPHAWHIVGSPPDGVAFLRRARGRLLPTEPRLRFVLVLLVTQGLLPEALQCACHQTVFRFDSGILPCRPLGAVPRPL
jgi:hypothetical protein